MDDKMVLTIIGSVTATLLAKTLWDFIVGGRSKNGHSKVCLVPQNWERLFKSLDQCSLACYEIDKAVTWLKSVHDVYVDGALVWQSVPEVKRIMEKVKALETKIDDVSKGQGASVEVLKALLEEIRSLTKAIIDTSRGRPERFK